MSLQDRSVVRTAADLERKYNLSQLAGAARNIETNSESLIKVQNELNDFISSTTGSLEEIQKQIDGSITTYYYSGVPTLSNLPASEWPVEEYKNHIGDLYYDKDTGYAYRFVLDGETNVYEWLELSDSSVSEALALANQAKDTADSKRRVFITTPYTPYDKGDLWLNNNELYVCINSKSSGSYISNDFDKATKYTDDTNLNNFVNITYKENMQSLATEIDGKISTWYNTGIPTLSSSPANDWKTDEEKLKHIGDLYYDKATGYCYRFEYSSNTYSWVNIKDEQIIESLALANAAKDTADGKRRIFTSQPTTPYDNGDLWVQGESGDIVVCQLTRAEGEFDEGDWIIASKYTDDTVAEAIVDELGGTQTTVLGGTVTQYTKNWVKFTDLATGSSTTISGDLIKTGTIDASKVRIANNNVVLDADGIKLNNGAKVVGNNGLMNTYLYENEGILGYTISMMWDDIAEKFISIIGKWDLILNFVIPKGLSITEAKLQLIHTPINWLTGEIDENNNEIVLGWGKCHNVKVFKATNAYSRILSAPLNAGVVYDTDATTYSEILDALGTSGWTPSITPSDTNHTSETTESIDIKSSLSEGFNRIKISLPEPSSAWNQDIVAANSGYMYAMLKINGYMTYE